MTLFSTNCRLKHLRVLFTLDDNWCVRHLWLLALLMVGFRRISNCELPKHYSRSQLTHVGVTNAVLHMPFFDPDCDNSTPRYLTGHRLDDKEKNNPAFAVTSGTVTVHVVYGNKEGFSLRLSKDGWFKRVQEEYEIQSDTKVDGELKLHDFVNKRIYTEKSPAPNAAITVEVFDMGKCGKYGLSQLPTLMSLVTDQKNSDPQWMGTLASEVKKLFPADAQRVYRTLIMMIESSEVKETEEKKRGRPRQKSVRFYEEMEAHSSRSPVRSPTPCPRLSSDGEDDDSKVADLIQQAKYQKALAENTAADLAAKVTECAKLHTEIKRLEEQENRNRNLLIDERTKWQKLEIKAIKQHEEDSKKVLEMQQQIDKLKERNLKANNDLVQVSKQLAETQAEQLCQRLESENNVKHLRGLDLFGMLLNLACDYVHVHARRP